MIGAMGALAGPFAFVITFAENWVSNRERTAERKSRTYKTWRYSAISASWSTVFEVILFADILLTVAEPLAIFPWVVVGGWLGQFLACEKTRKKFRANAANPPRRTKRRKNAEQGNAASGNRAGAGDGADGRESVGSDGQHDGPGVS